ncbi:RNA-binding protein 25-like, partial [Trifolium medium]|nr:RNA-binding protein 25-like [Trifolium medium]
MMREKGRERRSEGGRGLETTTHTTKHKPESYGFRSEEGKTTTFFITNFPEDAAAEELWRLLRRYWKLGEIYIPSKRDKHGKRFGFAKYVEVENSHNLLKKIEGTWMGTYKLRANLSKFKKGDGGAAGQVEQQAECINHFGPLPREGLHKGVSFKTAVEKT